MKKLFSILMSVFLILGCVFVPISPAVEKVAAATLWGIDVSEHQGVIDWEKAKAYGVDFAIIRCGYGQDQYSQDDPYWEYNSSECERLGIPYGTYIYSYAKSASAAIGEANHTLRLLEGKNLSYPVYFDMEDPSTVGYDYAAIASAYCNTIEAAGYSAGVYANLSWWNTRLTASCFDNWYKWIAQYSSSCDYRGNYEIWQYTDSAYCPGISGGVDANYQYSDVSGGSTNIAESLETNKTSYASGEDIYVTASTAKSGAWVAIYGADETIKSGAASYFWYWVQGNGGDYGVDKTWIRGREYNIYEGICSNRVVNGKLMNGYLPAGKYKIAILYDDYKVLMSKTITITEEKATYLELPATTFTQGDDIKVKAYSKKSGAWVGIFPGAKPTYAENYIYYYYTKDYNGKTVAIQDVGVKNEASNYTKLPAGTYTVTLFGDEGYNKVEYEQKITIKSAAASTSSLTTDKTAYTVGDPINVKAVCSTNGSWVGLYKQGQTPSESVPSQFWYYVKSNLNKVYNSGKTIQINTDQYANVAGTVLPAGTYKVILFGDKYHNNILHQQKITISEAKVVKSVKTVDATCTAAGSITTTYTDGTTEKVTIPKLGHMYTKKVVTPQTCTTRGYTTFTCTRSGCGHSYQGEYVDAIGHKRNPNDKPCQTSSCTICKVAMAATAGHTEVVDPAVAATCTTTGKTAGKHCSVCNLVTVAQTIVSSKGHTPGAAATCTTDQICTTCSTVLTKAPGHKPAEGVYCTDAYACTVCGTVFEEGAADHTWVPATCTEAKHCAVCPKTEGTSNGHDWAAATCTEPKTCKTAGCGVTEGEPAGHTAAVTPAKEATCEDFGLTEGSHCSVCQTVLTAQQVIPKSGHKMSAATCTSRPTCETCGMPEGEKLDHKWVEGEITVKPTCETLGTRVDVCEYGCGETKEVSLKAYGHKPVGTIVEPTCTTDGYTYYACGNSGCDHTYKDKYVVGGHTYGPDATCTARKACTVCGYETGSLKSHVPGPAATCTSPQTCVNCDYEYAPAKGHTPGAVATCTSDQTCKNCDKVFEKATGHVPGPAATCTSPQTCKKCDYVYEKVKPHTAGGAATCTDPQFCTECHEKMADMKGHTPGVAATCDKPQTCTVCNTVLVSAKGHKPTTVAGYAATCIAEGMTDGKACADCGFIYAQMTAIEKTGHSYETSVTPASKDADGKVTESCTSCSDVKSSQTIAKVAKMKLSITNTVYNGKQKKPSVHVFDSNGKEISSKFYTVTSPSGRTKVGKYTYTVQLKGNYEGELKSTLTIKPAKTTALKPVAGKKAITAKWTKVSKEATGYQVMIATNKGFTQNVKKVFVKGSKVTSKKFTNLKAKKTYYVKVRTYKTVGGVKMYSDWSKVKTMKTK